MEILKTVLTVLYVLDCVGLIIVVLMQEGKQQGLGSVAGMADTYWGKETDHVPLREIWCGQRK